MWVACDSFNLKSNKTPGANVLETASTPNLDALCQSSETGLMTTNDGRRFNRAEEFSMLTQLDSLAITNHRACKGLEKFFTFDRYETVSNLEGFEDMLETNWEAFDFFYIHLNGKYEALFEQHSDIRAEEWVEIVDAWLPGILGFFQPEVFALSGDLDAVLCESENLLALIHSPKTGSHSGEDQCRKFFPDGRLGKEVNLEQWILLLMAHSSRRESYRAALELFSR